MKRRLMTTEDVSSRFWFKGLLFLMGMCIVSCDQAPQARYYIEKTIPSPQLQMAGDPSDPHAHIPGFDEMMTDPHANIPGFKEMMEQRQSAQDPSSGGMSSGGMSPGIVAPGPAADLAWEVPEGWQEKPAGGMRMASFTGGTGDSTFDCSIVSLAGPAGGLEDNVRRWMGQINLTVPDDRLKKFLQESESFSSTGGFPVQIIDLTQLQAGTDNSATAILAAIVTLPDATIFVKLTATRKVIVDNREKFLSLCRSLKKKDG